MALLAVEDLSGRRNGRLLFERLTFQVAAGQALHILGPNGVGKTSLLRILTGLAAPAHGYILWNGVVVARSPCFKKNLLYISHKLGMKSALTPFENLHLFLLRRGIGHVGQSLKSLKQLKQYAKSRIREALLALDLMPHANTITGLLSVGQQRRLLLAKLLLTKADCWILDEPFTALDTKGIYFISTLIEEQLERGGIAVFTSHQSFFLPKAAVRKLFFGDTLGDVSFS